MTKRDYLARIIELYDAVEARDRALEQRDQILEQLEGELRQQRREAAEREARIQVLEEHKEWLYGLIEAYRKRLAKAEQGGASPSQPSDQDPRFCG